MASRAAQGAGIFQGWEERSRLSSCEFGGRVFHSYGDNEQGAGFVACAGEAEEAR